MQGYRKGSYSTRKLSKKNEDNALKKLLDLKKTMFSNDFKKIIHLSSWSG